MYKYIFRLVCCVVSFHLLLNNIKKHKKIQVKITTTTTHRISSQLTGSAIIKIKRYLFLFVFLLFKLLCQLSTPFFRFFFVVLPINYYSTDILAIFIDLKYSTFCSYFCQVRKSPFVQFSVNQVPFLFVFFQNFIFKK